MLRTTLAAALLLVPVAAIAQATPPAAPARYVDATNWPAEERGMDRFAELEASLGAGFNKVCGDTFCEGDYANLRPMQMRCSIDSTKGVLKQCLWTFSGSYAEVNPKSGAVQINAKLFKCKLPLAKDTPVETFYEVLSVENPLEAKLPMTRKSIYDGLAACL